ncbi:MAG: hypothetical protein M3142_08465 [Bacteroidota bacterium]|nr:hypothetical protein [Bacteroidota bacterium]
MKTLSWRILVLGLIYLLRTTVFAQKILPGRVTYTAKLTFQTYGFPFKNLGSAFKNIGGAINIDYAYNKAGNLQQSFTVGYQSHTQHEAGYYLNTQFFYRLNVFNTLEPAVGFGVGRLITVANNRSPFYEIENNTWKKSKQQTQGHWQTPLSLNLGFRTSLPNGTTITPFIGYDATPLSNTTTPS